jgi:hypothetical protein
MKGEKGLSHVTSGNQKTAAAVEAASKSTKRKVIGSTAIENVVQRQVERVISNAIQSHMRARCVQWQQARREAS